MPRCYRSQQRGLPPMKLASCKYSTLQVLENLLLDVIQLPCCEIFRLWVLQIPLLLGDSAIDGW